MAYTVREVRESDWAAILAAADAALPNEQAMNREWLMARQTFPAGRLARSHYVVETSGDGGDAGVVGYGAAEGEAHPGRFRVFVVMSPDLLDAGPADLLFDALLRELRSLRAQTIWTRELAYDQPLYRFFNRRGLVETQRYRSAGDVEVLVMEMAIRAGVRVP